MSELRPLNGDSGTCLQVRGETAYPLSAAASRVRIAEFVSFLRPHGVALHHCPTLTDAEYALLSSGASAVRKSVILGRAALRLASSPRSPHDLLLVQKLRFLAPVPGLDPPRRLDVYDFDDAIYLGSDRRSVRWLKQEAHRCATYLRRSRLTIAGNALLAAHARLHARHVEIVPTCVDPDRQPVRVHNEADELVVGWIGSRTTSAYLHPVLPVFERLNANGIRAKLVLVGADPAIKARWIEHRRWSLETQARDLASFDVGIMPLPDTAWARGKCGFKVLQYFAAGVPAVASPVGIARDLVGTERGVLATSSEEWRIALESILDDAGERRQRGAAARTFVERHYSFQRWAPELAAMLTSVAG
jgi:glycosyltransferase involved in cell wall biosynthesis